MTFQEWYNSSKYREFLLICYTKKYYLCACEESCTFFLLRNMQVSNLSKDLLFSSRRNMIRILRKSFIMKKPEHLIANNYSVKILGLKNASHSTR
jgi:hypothetical protein